MEVNNCALRLKELYFEKIEFTRKGSKNKNEPSFGFRIQIAKSKENMNKVTVELTIDKKQEYEVTICLSGIFKVCLDESMTSQDAEQLINKNAVAILMPYIRSQVSLITAQPGIDCIVFPPLNINQLLDDSEPN